MPRLLLGLLVVALLAGCGGSEDEATAQAHVYFLRDGKVWPVAREVDAASSESAALAALFEGPTAEEKDRLAATTAIPGGGPSLSVQGGVAHIQPAGQYSPEAYAQIVYTLTQFPGIRAVQGDRQRPYTRADFEDQTPLILVESPLPFEQVSSPLRVTGTANTFEATFQYELAAASGKILAKHFVTASSGNGVRGTFDVKVPFTVTAAGPGTLTVYENSAANGKRVNQVVLPVQLEP